VIVVLKTVSITVTKTMGNIAKNLANNAIALAKISMQKTINESKLRAAAKSKKHVLVKKIKAKLNNLKVNRLTLRKSMAVAKAQTKVLVNAKLAARKATKAKSGKKAPKMVKLLKTLKVVKVIRKKAVAARKIITKKIKISKAIKRVKAAIKRGKKVGTKVSKKFVKRMAKKAKKLAKKMIKIRVTRRKNVNKAAVAVKKNATKLHIRVKVLPKHCKCEPRKKTIKKVLRFKLKAK